MPESFDALSHFRAVHQIRNQFTGKSQQTERFRAGKLLDAIEEKVSADPLAHFRFDDQGFATLTVDDQSFAAGRFSMPSLAELRARVAAMNFDSESSRSSLSVLLGRDRLFDVGALQATASAGTLFQAASQFNCLEAPGATIVPINQYVSDPTQGPRASVSAFPGTFLRHYCAPAEAGETFVQGRRNGQESAPELNLLRDVFGPDCVEVQAGYLRSSGIRDPEAALEQLHDNFEQIRVGLHESVEVGLGADWDGPVARPAPVIHQVFTSTIALGGYSLFGAELTQFCEPLLRGAYLGTLLSARAVMSNRVVLTLIGGGVFGNPHSTIWRSILWAIEQLDQLPGPGIEVFVNVWGNIDRSVEEEVVESIFQSNGTIIEAQRGQFTVI